MRNRRLLHPETLSSVFGRIGDIDIRGFRQPGGIIVLKHGWHKGPHRGYGAVHIWAEHKTDMAEAGFHSWEDVPAYVAGIVLPGTPVHCEFSQLRGYQRLLVVRSARGTVVVEYRDAPQDSHYSVVTVFRGAKKHGPKVGTVLR